MKQLVFLLLLIPFLFACTEEKSAVLDTKEKGYFPYEDFFNARLFPETSFDHIAYFKQIEQEKNKLETRSPIGAWEDQGPGNIGGRVNAIANNKENPDVMFLGFSRGGLYKTIDAGENWRSVFNEFSYLSISHVEIDPNNSDVIFIGTGDENISHYPAIGNGVYKSEDAGETWKQVGLSEAAIISRMHVSPSNSNIVYASAMGIPFEKTEDRGVYKSIDGGTSWEQVLMINDSTGVIDMVVAPNNPDVVYAAGWNRLRSNNFSTISGPDARIHKTEDGGETWTIMENGLPEGDFVRIGLQMYGDEGDTVFAAYSRSGEEARCNSTAANFYGLYKTSNGGDAWEELPTDEDSTGLPCTFQGSFAWYFGSFAVNPQDENDIILLGVNSYRTRDSGMAWEPFTSFGPHVDHHDAVFLGDKIFLGTDGGAYSYTDLEGWLDIENISTNHFYRVEYNPHAPETYYGGLQDNGVVSGSGFDINNWNRISGGDGFQIRFNADDSSIVYTESQFGNIRKSEDGGLSFFGFTQGLTGARNWDMQYIISPHDQNVLYTGTDRLWARLSDTDETWFPISEDMTDAFEDPLGFREHNITCLSQSPINPSILYTGTSDGFVWSTEDGINFTNVEEGLPRRWISEVKASPTFERTVFVSVTGYKNNDFVPHIFRSDNLGQDWIDISGDLPNFAINDLYILEGFDDNYIFVATEIGVYATTDGGISWDRLGNDFPFIQCLDLVYNPEANQLIVGTYGKGLRTYDLEQLINVSTNDIVYKDIIQLLPNIASDEIRIHVGEPSSNLSYRIVDARGMSHSRQAYNSILDISDLTPGIYYLHVSDGKFAETEKFVKI